LDWIGIDFCVHVYLLGNFESRVNWKWTQNISQRVCLRVIDDDSFKSSVVSKYDWVLPDFDQNLRKLKTEKGLSQNSEFMCFWKSGPETPVLCPWYSSVTLFGNHKNRFLCAY
jgi:hypothetical protein